MLIKGYRQSQLPDGTTAMTPVYWGKRGGKFVLTARQVHADTVEGAVEKLILQEAALNIREQ